MQRTSSTTGSKRANIENELNSKSTTSSKYCRYSIHWYRLTSILIQARWTSHSPVSRNKHSWCTFVNLNKNVSSNVVAEHLRLPKIAMMPQFWQWVGQMSGLQAQWLQKIVPPLSLTWGYKWQSSSKLSWKSAVKPDLCTVKLRYNVFLGTWKTSTLYPRYVVTTKEHSSYFIINPNPVNQTPVHYSTVFFKECPNSFRWCSGLSMLETAPQTAGSSGHGCCYWHWASNAAVSLRRS